MLPEQVHGPTQRFRAVELRGPSHGVDPKRHPVMDSANVAINNFNGYYKTVRR